MHGINSSGECPDNRKKLFGQELKNSLLIPRGGLRVPSLRAKHLGLLQKWKWRWLTEEFSFWARIANGGQPGSLRFGSRTNTWSVWSDVGKASGEVDNLGPDYANLYRKEVRSGINTLFWEDAWNQGELLKLRFPRLYDLEMEKFCTVAERLQWERTLWRWVWSGRRELRGRAVGQFEDVLSIFRDLTPSQFGHDFWRWSPAADKFFQVRSLSEMITAHMAKWVPKKVNIFVCRATRRLIPVRTQLQDHVTTYQILWPIDEEKVHHNPNPVLYGGNMRDITLITVLRVV